MKMIRAEKRRLLKQRFKAILKKNDYTWRRLRNYLGLKSKLPFSKRIKHAAAAGFLLGDN